MIGAPETSTLELVSAERSSLSRGSLLMTSEREEKRKSENERGLDCDRNGKAITDRRLTGNELVLIFSFSLSTVKRVVVVGGD